MKLSEEIKNKITQNYQDWFEHQYAGKSLEERQKLAQFFTPADITIKMIEQYPFDSFDDRTILDPTVGSGNLLVGCIIAGAKPENCFGNDYDPIMVDLCRERLAEFGVPKNNIHQGNALHSFCITKANFTDSYDSEYFGRIDTNKAKRFEIMDNPESDENAWDRMQKRDAVLYQIHREKLRIQKLHKGVSNKVENDKEELW